MDVINGWKAVTSGDINDILNEKWVEGRETETNLGEHQRLESDNGTCSLGSHEFRTLQDVNSPRSFKCLPHPRPSHFLVLHPSPTLKTSGKSFESFFHLPCKKNVF